MTAALSSSFGPAAVLAHVVFAHDHDDPHEHAQELEAAIHGHAHEPGTPSHEHRLSSPAVSPLASASKRFVRSAAMPLGLAVVSMVIPERSLKLAPTSASPGVGPPGIVGRSPILRI